MLGRLITNFKTRKIYWLVSALLLIIGGVLLVTTGNGQAVLVTVERGEVIQEVRVTGKTKPAESVELAFERTGKVARVPADIGDLVTVGQTLVVLDQSELQADLLKAKAILAEEQAKLDDTIKSSVLSLDNAESNMTAQLADAFTKADDAVRTKGDQLFNNPQSNNAYLTVNLFDTQTQAQVNNSRVNIEHDLVAWKQEINLTGQSDYLLTLADQALTRLFRIQNFLDQVSLGINGVPTGTEYENFTLSTVRSDINTGRANVTTAINNLIEAVDKINTASKKTATDSANEFDAVRVQEARVAQFAANVAAIEAQLGKTVITAPINGVVTSQEAKVGQIMTAGTPVVSVITGDSLEIEANISEINIGKVALGNPVQIDFDAFPGQVFSGQVSYIEPAETLVDNVVNYQVTVVFTEVYPGLKTGLTANLALETARRANVLRLPAYALNQNDDGFFVRRRVATGEVVEVPVTVGLMGNDGLTEIIAGLNEGEVVEALEAQ